MLFDCFCEEVPHEVNIGWEIKDQMSEAMDHMKPVLQDRQVEEIASVTPHLKYSSMFIKIKCDQCKFLSVEVCQPQCSQWHLIINLLIIPRQYSAQYHRIVKVSMYD